ncbi:MAG: roadblock/LC7 domain-containing protein [Verrucomicrobia bacterium]|nr:roadblock/LC7 domain-containing protein [Verrucomicrobiota bacterium]
MFTLPQLLEEDVTEINAALRDLVSKSESLNALVIDKGGFLVTNQGHWDDFDSTTVAALSAGSYAANGEIANLIGEKSFSHIYQQGETHSLLVSNIDENVLLCVIFKGMTGVGAVKYYATTAVQRIAEQLKKAGARDPESGLDLSVLNMADTGPLFPRKTG